MNRFPTNRLAPIIVLALVAACLLTTCSIELLEEIQVDIETYVASTLPKNPEIKVSVDGRGLVSGFDAYFYPEKVRADGGGGDLASATFTVSNLGNGELTISRAELSGAGAGNFAVDTAGMLSTLDPAGEGSDSTTFTVNFDPAASGTVSANVVIINNDEDEATYTFAVAGTAEWWGFQSIASVGDITDLANYGEWPLYQFGSILVVPENTFVDGDEIMIAYTDLSSGNVMFTKSTDGGITWSTPAIAASWQVTDWSARCSAMALDGDTVYLAFREYFDNGSTTLGEVRLVKSADRGVTWGGASDIGELADASTYDAGYYLSIGVDPVTKDVYISHYNWYDQDLRLARWDDSAMTWITSVVDNTSSRIGEYASMVNVGETLYIGYFDYTNGVLRFSKSVDGGANWVVQTTADSNYPHGAYASLVVDESDVFMSYIDFTDLDLWFLPSADGGVTWDAANDAVMIESTDNVGYYSSIDVDGSDIYISYYDWTNYDLKFVHSADGGTTWPAEPISPLQSTDDDVGKYTTVKAAGDNVYILYYDQTNGNLMLAKSIDRGESW